MRRVRSLARYNHLAFNNRAIRHFYCNHLTSLTTLIPPKPNARAVSYSPRLRQAKQFCAEVQFERVARGERDFRAVVEEADERVVGCGVVVDDDVAERAN